MSVIFPNTMIYKWLIEKYKKMCCLYITNYCVAHANCFCPGTWLMMLSQLMTRRAKSECEHTPNDLEIAKAMWSGNNTGKLRWPASAKLKGANPCDIIFYYIFWCFIRIICYYLLLFFCCIIVFAVSRLLFRVICVLLK